MIPIRVTQRDGAFAIETDGFAPFEGSPLAVVPVVQHSRGKWYVRQGRWQICHVATGHQLACAEWPTPGEAMVILMRCEPQFPAWRMAPDNAAALDACRVKFKGATECK